MKRVLITGSRDWSLPGPVMTALMAAWNELGPFVLVHGDARGADRMAAGYHARWGGRVEAHPADWSIGKRAGFVRNAEMVAAGADLCLAFIRNESRGATMCARLAEEAGIPTRRFIA